MFCSLLFLRRKSPKKGGSNGKLKLFKESKRIGPIPKI